MRQCAPDNHVLDLVVVCMLSPLRMLLSRMALLLLWLCTATYSAFRPGWAHPRYRHLPPHFSHHAPFLLNPHRPMTQPLPPLLALAPHHSQPPQRRRDVTPVDSPFMAKRDRERVPDARDTGRDVSKTTGHARSV